MSFGEMVMQLAKTHTINNEHTMVADTERFLYPNAVEIMPAEEDKIPNRKLESKTVKTKCSVFICGIIPKM